MNGYRIVYQIQHVVDGEETEIGFGSSGTWGDVDQAAFEVESAIQNREWETRPGQPDPRDVGAEAAAPEPGRSRAAPREPGSREETVGFMALGATERVMELLRSETSVHRTIAGLAHSAQVSRTTVQKLIRRLENEGQLDIRQDLWPNGYLLKPEARARTVDAGRP